jgi:hypothetical protein
MADESVAPESGEWQQATQTQYDPDCGSELGTEIVYVVATAKNVDPLDHDQLPVLYDVVDAESLEETLLDDGNVTRPDDSRTHVSFEYADVLVTIENNGWITVYERQ